MNNKSAVINFRCPAELLDRLQAVSDICGRSRNAIVADAIQLFCEHVKRNGGHIAAPYKRGIHLEDGGFRFIKVPQRKK